MTDRRQEAATPKNADLNIFGIAAAAIRGPAIANAPPGALSNRPVAGFSRVHGTIDNKARSVLAVYVRSNDLFAKGLMGKLQRSRRNAS